MICHARTGYAREWSFGCTGEDVMSDERWVMSEGRPKTKTSRFDEKAAHFFSLVAHFFQKAAHFFSLVAHFFQKAAPFFSWAARTEKSQGLGFFYPAYRSSLVTHHFSSGATKMMGRNMLIVSFGATKKTLTRVTRVRDREKLIKSKNMTSKEK